MRPNHSPKRATGRRVVLAATASLLIAGCSSSETPPPNLSTVPGRPQATTEASRQAVSGRLAADRQNANYTEEVIRRGDPTAPVRSTSPAPQSAAKPAAAAPTPAKQLADAPRPADAPPAHLNEAGQIETPAGYRATSAPPAPPAAAPVADMVPPPIPDAPPPPPNFSVPTDPTATRYAPPPSAPRAAAEPRAERQSKRERDRDLNAAYVPPPAPVPAPVATSTPAPVAAPAPVPAAPPGPPPLTGRTAEERMQELLKSSFNNTFRGGVPASAAINGPAAAPAPAPTAPAAVSATPLAAPPQTRELGAIYFDGGSAHLGGDDRAVIAEAAKVIAQRGARVTVIGHVSAGGDGTAGRKPAAALELSGRRADAVAAALIQHGVDPARVAVVSASVDRPRYDETAASGRAGNRRVDIRLD